MKKTILVTGASGLLGGNVVKQLVNTDNKVVAAIMPIEEATYKQLDDVEVVFNDDIFNGNLPHIDAVINCAFARSNNAVDLVNGLDFTEKLIKGFEMSDIDGVINISSQGVYKRLPVGELCKEDSPIDPMDLYSMAKYSVEKMFEIAKLTNYTNVRLASINMRQRFFYKFVESVKAGKPISLNSPNVYASLLDVKDAAAALIALALKPAEEWARTYNLGIGNQYSLGEYAEIVKEVGVKLGYDVQIEINDNGNTTTAGMDSTLLQNTTGWHPLFTNAMMAEEMFNW